MILRGMFLDLFYNCPYEMHQLTADPFLSQIVNELSDLHKETLYLLSLQYLSTSQLSHMRDQSDRNIRKLRDNYTKKLQKQLFGHLLQKKQDGMGLSFREKEFLTQYELVLKESGTANVKVKKENKYPKRIRKTGTANSTGTEVGVADRVPTGCFHPYWKPGGKGTCSPFTIPAVLKSVYTNHENSVCIYTSQNAKIPTVDPPMKRGKTVGFFNAAFMRTREKFMLHMSALRKGSESQVQPQNRFGFL